MHTISDRRTRKFVDTIHVDDWEIETESGWVDIEYINKTIPYEVYQLKTDNCCLECADTHIVFREDHSEVFVQDLFPDDVIIGENGLEKVISVTKTDRLENMYDLTVGGDHTFYAEGLLHHNTTTSAAYILWYGLFNDLKTSAVLANKQATAFEIMDRIKFGYEELPLFLQQGIKTWNRGSIVLENGSQIFGAATSKSAIRGRTISGILMMDEGAFIPNTQAEEFFTAVFPTLSASKEAKFILTSTPNGFNFFHKIWSDAEKGINGFFPIRSMWYEHPDRDQKWYEEQKAALGPLKTAQECDCNFNGSAMQLLAPHTMSSLSYSTPIQIFTEKYQGLKLYTLSKPENHYVMTVDVSRGRHLDASAFLIIDVTKQPYTIAASYSNNEVAPLMYAAIIHTMAKQYNDAYILVEINDIGGQVAESLHYDFEYGNMFWSKSGEILGKRGADPYPGIRTTKKTKRIGCANLKDMVEKQNFLINDFQLIRELSTFVQSTTGSYEADEGFHDDMVMCGVLFAWLASQVWFKDLTDQDMRQEMYAKQLETIEEELTPFGFISNAANDFIETPRDINSKEALEFFF